MKGSIDYEEKYTNEDYLKKHKKLDEEIKEDEKEDEEEQPE